MPRPLRTLIWRKKKFWRNYDYDFSEILRVSGKIGLNVGVLG